MSHPKIAMTGIQFSEWAATMIAIGRVKKETDLPELLGITRQGFWLMKGRGCDRRTALACTALWHLMLPWNERTKSEDIKQSS